MKKSLLIVIVVCQLTGCGIYSKYERKTDIPVDSLYGQSFFSDDTSSLADLSWQQFFTDPYLSKLIEKGLLCNTDLKKAQLDVEKAESSLKSAKLSWLPTLNLAPSGNVTEFDNWNNMQFGADWTYSLNVAASWEIETFGRITNSIRGAKVSKEMADNYRQAVHSGLICSIANQYYTLLMLDQQVELASAIKERLSKSTDVLKSMKKAGLANATAVAQMEAATYSVEASVEDMKKSVSDIETSLSLILHETPHHINRGCLDSVAFPDKFEIGVPAALLSNRPDVRAAENKLAAAYYAHNAARASLYPSLNLSGVASWTNDLGTTVVNPGGLLLNAAASLAQPVFNHRKLKTAVEITEADRKQAELDFEQAALKAGAEVNDALVQYQSATKKEKSRTLQIDALTIAVEKTEKLMKFSSTTYLEVLAAQQSLLTAETSRSQDQFDKIQAVITLYRALGGGRD